MYWMIIMVVLVGGIVAVAAIAHRSARNCDLYMPDFEDIL